MNLKFFLEKLQNSKIFKQFKEENPDAFLCSGFFSIDKTGKEENNQHFDYYIPKTKKIFSFKMHPEIEKIPVDRFEDKTPKEILGDYNFDFQEIEEIILKEIEKKGIKNKIQKILLSLQSLENKNFLIGTVFISSLGMIKIKISLPENKIIEFEKKSFLDMFKVIKKRK